MTTPIQLALFTFPDATLPPAPDWIEALFCSHRLCDEVATATIFILGRLSNVCAFHAAQFRTL